MDLSSIQGLLGMLGNQGQGAQGMQTPNALQVPGGMQQPGMQPPQQPGMQPPQQPGMQPPQQPGFGLGQALLQGGPNGNQFAQQQGQPDQMSFMQRLQAMMGGNQPFQTADPNAQGGQANPTGGLGDKLAALQMMQRMAQPNGMQGQSPMQNMQFMQNQMHRAGNPTQASQGYLAQGGGIAPQRRIVGNGY